MKTTCSVLALVAILSACSGSKGSPSDPPGTAAASIRTHGNGLFQINFATGQLTRTAPCPSIDLFLDSSGNFTGNDGTCETGTRIKDVGSVGSLGAIASMPVSGFKTSVQATPGRGYVIQSKTPGTNNGNWRLYATSYITSATSGGVIGIRIKYAPMPSTPVYLRSSGRAEQQRAALDKPVGLSADIGSISLESGGTQTLSLNAGVEHADGTYWIFGSASGVAPGITVGKVHLPLNLDPYTETGGSPLLTLANVAGTLDGVGRATVVVRIPPGLPTRDTFTLHHAYLVLNDEGQWLASSNSVKLRVGGARFSPRD